MPITEPCATHPDGGNPRHPHQEIADILAAGMLRLRAASRDADCSDESRASTAFGLGFTGHQRVNANPYPAQGVRT